jgi:tRNA dimethylallyltransferase
MEYGKDKASLPLVIAIVGPTCTGKTELAIELALKLKGEIIACDSRTVYKRMDIGTAKPTLVQQAKVNHHIIDVIEPERFYSAFEFQDSAKKVAHGILAENKIPLIVGGTGLYARALLQGIQPPAIPAQEDIRKYLNAFADEYGNSSLHIKLKELDPLSAKRLDVNDRIRIIRALEVSMVAQKPFSSIVRRVEPVFETLWIGLCWSDKNRHKETIASRFNNQLELGLLEEVRDLWLNPAYHGVLKRAINYKEFQSYLENDESLEIAREQCLLHNLQLARKQMMWFKTNQAINWFLVDRMASEQIFSQILSLYARRLDGSSYTD